MHPPFGVGSICFLNRGPLGVDLFVHNVQLVLIDRQHVLQAGQLAPTGLGHGMRFLKLIRTRMFVDSVFAVRFCNHSEGFVQTQP